MQKHRKALKKTTPKSIAQPYTPSDRANNEKPSFFWVVFTLLKNRYTFLLLCMVGITVGIAVQINWMQIKCSNEPLRGSAISYCSNNHLRILLGGPLFLMILLIITASFHRMLAAQSIMKSAQKSLLLLPLLFLPLISNETHKGLLAAAAFILFFGVWGFMLRSNLIGFFKKILENPSFSIQIADDPNGTSIHLSGVLKNDERTWIYESVAELFWGDFLKGPQLQIDVSSLSGYTTEYRFLFQMLAAISSFHGNKIYFIGNEILVHAIEDSLIVRRSDVQNSLSNQ